MSQYRKGYIFEKKTNSLIQEILSQYKELKLYSVESRGSKGAADIVFGLYNKKNMKRIWFGIQCKRGYVSTAEKRREISSAFKKFGMIMFYSTPAKENKTNIEFFPDFLKWLDTWVKNQAKASINESSISKFE